MEGRGQRKPYTNSGRGGRAVNNTRPTSTSDRKEHQWHSQPSTSSPASSTEPSCPNSREPVRSSASPIRPRSTLWAVRFRPSASPAKWASSVKAHPTPWKPRRRSPPTTRPTATSPSRPSLSTSPTVSRRSSSACSAWTATPRPRTCSARASRRPCSTPSSPSRIRRASSNSTVTM